MTSLIVSAFAGCGSTDSSDSTETSETESDSEAETEASSDDFGVWTALAGDNGTTYPNLFKVILSDEDYSYRYDYSAAVVGEDNAKSTVDYLRSFISADIYGDEAVAAYADTELYTVIGEDGHGETYMNGEKSTDYNAYAYDNDEKGDGKGIYVAYSNLTGEVSHAEYTIEEEDGKTVLTFVNDEGAISYVKRAE